MQTRQSETVSVRAASAPENRTDYLGIRINLLGNISIPLERGNVYQRNEIISSSSHSDHSAITSSPDEQRTTSSPTGTSSGIWNTSHPEWVSPGPYSDLGE